MKDFWNDRYARPVYAYGEGPNTFWKHWVDELDPGRALLPAEGEGRNAVYAARRGWTVDAMDQSETGREKALDLAARHGVDVDYRLGDLSTWEPNEDAYDLIGLIYVHLPHELRRKVHQRMARSLRPGGHLVIEAFHVDNLDRRAENPQVGGPGDERLLYTPQMLEHDLRDLDIVHCAREEVDLDEGDCHVGRAVVIRTVARRT